MLIAQISDPHITLPGRPMEIQFGNSERLKHAVEYLRKLPTRPDVVVVTGDAVDEGTLAEYERFKNLIAALESLVLVIPGNHDNRSHLRQAFGEQGMKHQDEYIQYVVDLGPVRLIALDSLIEGQGHGRLCTDRLEWLEERLSEDSVSPTIIMLHHPPFAVGLPVLDEPSLEGQEELGRLVATYENIERLIAGHIHCHVQRRFHGTIALTCPSTTLNSHPDLNQTGKQWGVMSTPSCLLHYWSETTGLVTHSCPIEDPGPIHLVHDGTNWIELTQQRNSKANH